MGLGHDSCDIHALIFLLNELTCPVGADILWLSISTKFGKAMTRGYLAYPVVWC